MNHIVIVGGGFAGLNCARKLSALSDVRITLIDKNNYQQFQPWCAQVKATAILHPGNAAFSLRSIFRNHANVNVKLGEVISADLLTRTVHTRDGKTYQGDGLALAAGVRLISSAHMELTSMHIRCIRFATLNCSALAS